MFWEKGGKVVLGSDICRFISVVYWMREGIGFAQCLD